jgi:hypothetical protein
MLSSGLLNTARSAQRVGLDNVKALPLLPLANGQFCAGDIAPCLDTTTDDCVFLLSGWESEKPIYLL